MSSMFTKLALLALALDGVAQEMPGKGMSCWDKHELCDLNCLMPVERAATFTFEIDELDACLAGCTTESDACVELPTTSQYIDCATLCTKTYEAALMECNQAVPVGPVGTYGNQQDACANRASGEMDDCMQACYFGEGASRDRFELWSPEREEGHNVTSIPRGQWRRPFRDENVILGKSSGDGPREEEFPATSNSNVELFAIEQPNSVLIAGCAIAFTAAMILNLHARS